ncbi:MAG: beta-ketoacyl-[acyl-carrier-protein] synthase family protein [Desulfobacteraceae bacterium]|jgi:3-oxoacyl-[acyl-carrier-protein] synthase II|nr:beta-ketoacyl-[acyl-carrier-protein] synthase family protein [Desulfobacteraceae bacterium]
MVTLSKSIGDRKSVIVGYDAVSPLGSDLNTQWENGINGKSGIAPLTRFQLSDNFPVHIAGEVPDIDTSPYPFLSPRELANWKSPIFKYAMLVVHRALEMSGIEITDELSPRVAVTFSSAVGGLETVIQADRRMMAEGKLPHPFTNPNSCINMVGGKISILTHATGPITSSITACSTGTTSMIMGAMLLETGKADVAICGAVDFALVETLVAGFATMNGAYKKKPNQPEEPAAFASRPFSINRRGFVISEGAGAIILTTKEFADTHGLNYSIQLAGWGMTSDAHHFVAPHVPTVSRCIAESIQHSGISPEDIDAINAHAASTQIGDKVEFEALKNIFRDNIPPTTANKSLIGHAMGASSAIETIFAMEGMNRDTLLPTINYQPDPEIPINSLQTKPNKLKQEFVLKNAFGFGGCNSCVVLQKIN